MQTNVTMILTGDPAQFQTDLAAMRQLAAQAGLSPAASLIVIRDGLYENATLSWDAPASPISEVGASQETFSLVSECSNRGITVSTRLDNSLTIKSISIPYFRAEPVMDLLQPLLTEADLVLLSPGPEGDELAARLSIRMQGSGITCARGFSLPKAADALDASSASPYDRQCEAIAPSADEFPSGGLLVQRSTCAGHLMSTSLLPQPPYFLSLDRSVRASVSVDHRRQDPQGTSAETATLGDEGCVDAPTANVPHDGVIPDTAVATCSQGDIESAFSPWSDPLQPSDLQVSREPGDDSLAGARRILAAGRGIGSARNVQPLYDAARELDAALGASRPVVMSAWLPMEHQLGVSGRLVSPDLLIALGISGSPAFYAGIEGARTIVAVNTDPNAPIMRKADLALVCDWKQFLQALQELQAQVPR